jgi:Flp pilus assembly protein TadG
MRPSRRWAENDDGSASLEFITAGFVLLLPLVYLVLTMSSIQAGAFAVEGASRQAARVFVQADTIAEANAAASRAVEFALADYGLDTEGVTVTVTCRPNPADCLQRRGFVTVVVSTSVALPLVPPVLDLDVPLSIPVESSATQQVSRFAGSR